MNSRTLCAMALLVALKLAGCNGNSETRYIPAGSKARQALETALNAWKAGEPLKTIQADGYVINPLDARWRGGAKLESFEILAEGPADPHPTFSVSVKLDGKEEQSEYRVLGIDPIWVFREEDYDRTTGM